MDTGPVASAVAVPGIGRRGVLTAGVGAALALATLTEEASAAAAATSGWRWCNRCQGMFRGKGTRSVGVCPKGGAHKPAAGFNYLLLSGLSVNDPSFPKTWSQCQKCRGLFQDDAAASGVCPVGGKHVRTGPQYGLWIGGAPPFPPFMEADWDRCGLCQGLFWAGATNSACPSGGEHQGGGFNILLILLR